MQLCGFIKPQFDERNMYLEQNGYADMDTQWR